VGLKGIGFLCAQSSLQTTVSRSTAEVEYRAGDNACQVILGLRKSAGGDGSYAGGGNSHSGRQRGLHSDVQVRVKHIKIDHHFVRAHVKEGNIQLVFTATQLMVADIMTKALARVAFEQHRGYILGGKL
jgi:hypothetical protein